MFLYKRDGDIMSKLKIIGICGSPHLNGNTTKLIKKVLEGCEAAGAETEFISLANKKIIFCRACDECLEKGECIINSDDVNKIRKKMLDADGLVIGSPTYTRDITGQLKAFFDRLFYDNHRQTFLGKYAVCVGTYMLSSGYAPKILKSLTMTLGYYIVKAISAKLWEFDNEIDNDDKDMENAFNAGIELVKSIKTQKKYRVQDLIRKLFIIPAFIKVDKLLNQ